MTLRLPLWTLAVALSVALAGCSGGDDPIEPTECEGAECPSEGGSGSIAGTVVTEDLEPVANATVALSPRGGKTTTDGAGAFLFEDLPPATYTLLVQALGFDSLARQVAVSEGESVEVEAQLVAIAVAEPYTAFVPFAGHFECSYAVADMFWRGCGYPVHETIFPNDATTHHYEKMRGAVQIVNELTWQPASLATGSDLDFSVVSKDRDGCQWYGNVFGPPPLSILITVDEEFQNPDSPAAVGTCGDRVVNELDTQLGVLVLSSPTYAGGLATAGMTLQQDFEGVVTVFYHQSAPPDYSGLPDA